MTQTASETVTNPRIASGLIDRSLNELLYALQIFEYRCLELSRPSGNGFTDARWRISWIQTAGGEQFRFCQVHAFGGEGSGIYHQSLADAEAFAQECVRNLFKGSGPYEADANDYDWHPMGGLADL